ncbi:hypothetical protein [Endozoicomonas atrinae]|uniref:hypothetical protein n=1 Tax=Endozoicomonas atrinae TaxID=1333660 RepID=UPI000B02AC50|nr:hypothetical protein [Endozoicomonas atrinae]
MNLVKVIAIAAFSVFMTACVAGKPIHNIDNATVNVTGTKEVSTADVRKAILKATSTKGWTVKEIAPGQMEATVHVRDHTAVVDIDYSKTNYSIQYKNSINLNHKGDTIHRNYNKWIILLDREIQKELINSSL